MKNATVAIFSAVCIPLTIALLGTDLLAQWDIEARVTHIDGKKIDLRHFGVWVPKCDKDRFWGKMFIYRDDDSGIPGDIYLIPGRACWDWSTRSWVVQANAGYFLPKLF